MTDKSRYEIERDERDNNGGLTVIGNYSDWQSAMSVWKSMMPHPNWRIQFWLVGVFVLRDGTEQRKAVDFKSVE